MSDDATDPVEQMLELYRKMSPADQSRADQVRMIEQVGALSRGQEALRLDMKMQGAESENRFNAINDSLRKVADAGARRTFHSEKYYTRSAVGGCFAPNISGKRMSKLLRVIGVLGVEDYILTPYMRGQEPIARRRPNTDYPTWEFHVAKLKTLIDKWLVDHEQFDDFHATVTKDERDAFIDMLYEEYAS